MKHSGIPPALQVRGAPVHCERGGKDFDPALSTIVFVHGALNDHRVWSEQAHWFAARGWNVLAPDLPGHGASGGAPLAAIEDMADWLVALLDAACAERALLAGHSMGSLVALETASRAPQRVSGLALLGSAFPMKVADALLATAREDEQAAIEMVARWSAAGAAAQEGVRRLMLDLAARAPGRRLLHTDLAACNAYANGAAAAAAVRCPALFVVGSADKMTPPRSMAALAQAIDHGKIVHVDAGHAMMAEQGVAVREALAGLAGA